MMNTNSGIARTKLMYSVAMLRRGGFGESRITATSNPKTSERTIEMTLMASVHSRPHSSRNPRSLTTRQSNVYGTT